MSTFFHLNEKGRIFKNFVAFNLSIILIFAAYDDIASISSILNQDESLGTSSQAVIYTFQFLTALVWPQVIIHAIGFKLTLVLAEFCFLLFYIANALPSWFTLMPTSILAGFANSLLWTTLGMYFTLLSKRFAFVTNRSFTSAQSSIFGWFGFLFLTNYILGSAWIASILEVKELPLNSTFSYSENCGMKNCPSTKLPEAASKPTIRSIYILFGVLILETLIAILISVIFVDDLKYDEDLKPIQREKISIKTIKNKFKEEFGSLFELSKSIDIWLLSPIAMYLGFELTILWFEFNRAFVSCLKSVNYIGWTNIVFGACASIISGVFGIITKYTGMQFTMIIMLVTALGHSIFILIWTPTESQSYVVFIMVVTFAFTNCLATSQVRAIFGIHFPENDSAYSCAIIFETFGLVMGSVISIHFCTSLKMYIYMFIVVFALISFIILEIKRYRAQSNYTMSLSGMVNKNYDSADSNFQN